MDSHELPPKPSQPGAPDEPVLGSHGPDLPVSSPNLETQRHLYLPPPSDWYLPPPFSYTFPQDVWSAYSGYPTLEGVEEYATNEAVLGYNDPRLPISSQNLETQQSLIPPPPFYYTVPQGKTSSDSGYHSLEQTETDATYNLVPVATASHHKAEPPANVVSESPMGTNVDIHDGALNGNAERIQADEERGTSQTSGARTAARRIKPKIIVEPTPERQIIYNRVRGEFERQQHDDQWLHLPTHQSIHMSRSSSSASTSLTEAERRDQLPRPRRRRHGPLNSDTRLRTALRRSLKLVCNDCRSRKVVCDCYDTSRLEEAYTASRGPTASRGLSSAASEQRCSSSAASEQRWYRAKELEFPSDGVDNIMPEDIANSDWGESSSPWQSAKEYASQFNAQTLLFGPIPAKATPYKSLSAPPLNIETGLSAYGFAVGSEVAEDPAGRWRCEFSSNSDTCLWTGPLDELNQHWRTSHHPIRQEEPWSECTNCCRLRMGWDKPYLCLDELCSPTGATWKRWLYGRRAVGSPMSRVRSEDSEASLVPSLTYSGVSDSEPSYPSAPWNTMPVGSQEDSSTQSNRLALLDHPFTGLGHPQEPKEKHRLERLLFDDNGVSVRAENDINSQTSASEQQTFSTRASISNGAPSADCESTQTEPHDHDSPDQNPENANHSDDDIRTEYSVATNPEDMDYISALAKDLLA